MADDATEAIRRHPDREHRERVYYEVLRVVTHTADERPGISAHELWSNRQQTGIDMSAVRSAVQAACENDDLLKIHDADGTARYLPAEPEALRAALRWIDEEWAHPDQELIARLNRALQEADE